MEALRPPPPTSQQPPLPQQQQQTSELHLEFEPTINMEGWQSHVELLKDLDQKASEAGVQTLICNQRSASK